MSQTTLIAGAALLVGLPLLLSVGLGSKPNRTRVISPADERVLIIGASSGVGRATAVAYAKRGARVAIVARRESLLEDVKQECARASGAGEENKFLAVVADFTNEVDVEKVRGALQQGEYLGAFSKFRA